MPMCPSPVTRMVALLFGWVCEACLCPACTIFLQLELIHTLERDFGRGPVSVSCTVLLTEVAQATGHTHKLGGLCRLPVTRSMSPSENCPWKPLEREVHTLCWSAMSGAFLLEKRIHCTRWKVVCLAGHFWLKQIASLIPGLQETLRNVNNNRITPDHMHFCFWAIHERLVSHDMSRMGDRHRPSQVSSKCLIETAALW